MTQKEWEKSLLRHLGKLSKNERSKIAEYYRELYGDKLDAGDSPERILAEFGAPKECAERILAEEYGAEDPSKTQHVRKKSGVSAATVVGLCFLTLILILPLTCVAITLMAAFATLTVGGCAISLCGLLVIVWTPFNYVGAAGILMGIGAGITAVGLGAVLFVLLWLATKYTAIGTYRALRFIYGRGERHE